MIVQNLNPINHLRVLIHNMVLACRSVRLSLNALILHYKTAWNIEDISNLQIQFFPAHIVLVINFGNRRKNLYDADILREFMVDRSSAGPSRGCRGPRWNVYFMLNVGCKL